MNKYSLENGKYIVYAENEQEAKKTLRVELIRIEHSKALISGVLTERGEALKNFKENTDNERLCIHFNSEDSKIFDEDSVAKGEVRHQRDESGNALKDENGLYLYELAYKCPEIIGDDAKFRLAHEMGHLLLNVSDSKKQTYDEQSNSRKVSGLIRRDESTKQLYGQEMQENAINLIVQLAIRGNVKADDIIEGNVDLSEENSYKKCDNLVKMLAISMKNDFEEGNSFEKLARNGLDAMFYKTNRKQEPVNIFFYGILNDSSIIENEFDKYMGKNAWKELNIAFRQLHQADISEEKFNSIFNSTQDLIKEFANVRLRDKYREIVIEEQKFGNVSIEKELRSINELAEINGENKEEASNNLVKFRRKNEDILSTKQKIARFLQKNNIFTNFSFVDNFIHKQLDVLAEQKNELEIKGNQTNKKRNKFLKEISNNGEYKEVQQVRIFPNSQSKRNIKETNVR